MHISMYERINVCSNFSVDAFFQKYQTDLSGYENSIDVLSKSIIVCYRNLQCMFPGVGLILTQNCT